jgi:replication-associated recombination protein RarA
VLYGQNAYEPSFGQFVAAVGGIPHNTILYGPPKIGKTTFVGSAAYL